MIIKITSTEGWLIRGQKAKWKRIEILFCNKTVPDRHGFRMDFKNVHLFFGYCWIFYYPQDKEIWIHSLQVAKFKHGFSLHIPLPGFSENRKRLKAEISKWCLKLSKEAKCQ